MRQQFVLVLVFTQTSDGATLLQYRCMKTVRQIAMCVTSSLSSVHRIVPIVPDNIQRIDRTVPSALPLTDSKHLKTNMSCDMDWQQCISGTKGEPMGALAGVATRGIPESYVLTGFRLWAAGCIVNSNDDYT